MVWRTMFGRGRWLLVLLTLAVTMVWRSESRGQGESIPPSHVLVENEELTYNVRYGPFDLGQVRLKVLSSWNESGARVYHCRALIDSYKGVPFVSLHAIYESVVDSAAFSHRFNGKTKDGDIWRFGRYTFDYAHGRGIIEVGERDSVVAKRDTMEISGPLQDGLSLFYCARQRLYDNHSETIPTVVTEQKVTTRINFRNGRTEAKVDAIDYPVDVVYFDGVADFVGVYGMTGGFEGWFSNDEARIPILAKMQVIIGSVTIELMEWKRPGWTPPKAKG